MAIATITPLYDVEQTSAEMERLVRAYAADIGERAKWPLIKFFDFVKGLEYRADPVGVESVSRPGFSMLPSWPWRDCDDKAVLIGSWCFLNGVPFRFEACSNRNDLILHHVYVVANIAGKETILDATYPKNIIGKTIEQKTTQQLTGDIMNQNLLTLEGYAELGSIKSLFRKAKNVAKKVSKIPGLKEAAKAAISTQPGGAAIFSKLEKAGASLSKTGAAVSDFTNEKYKDSFYDSSSYDPSAGAVSAASDVGAPVAQERPKWLIPAAIAGGVAVLYLATRKKA